MSSPIPRTNSGSNTNKLNQEILYLVYKFIAQSGRFKNTRKCLKDELVGVEILLMMITFIMHAIFSRIAQDL